MLEPTFGFIAVFLGKEWGGRRPCVSLSCLIGCGICFLLPFVNLWRSSNLNTEIIRTVWYWNSRTLLLLVPIQLNLRCIWTDWRDIF